MTQRIHPLAQPGASRRTLKARAQAVQAAADAAPRGAIDRVWSAAYMSISLLAIVAACAIAGGEAANAELRFATVATSAPPLVRCIPHGARNFQIRPSIQQRKSA
ncbi:MULTISPECIES: hypothetical protein [Variovorax]|jgi:hypothetical protein|uniref:Uncharacterized protein n=2 Tax=Variovorax paradoxus TaxID=34073 RepID=A0AAW8EI45_VARPD|nr:hypothetical protein [Variovorax paradoxus]MBW8715699.1 hypothetical protein [Variovorax paradoxus]MBW8892382.1 hypothetical protein [Burkholderiales bacterium]MDP9972302.1 hypothetical protein [Variovorax paradoxus]